MINKQIYKKIRREIALSHEVVRGSLVFLDRLCGKPNCRCVKGKKHRSLYLSRSYKGKTTMRYVPKKYEAKLIECASRWQKIQSLLNELSQANLKKILEDR